jgi:hypothetical protein
LQKYDSENQCPREIVKQTNLFFANKFIFCDDRNPYVCSSHVYSWLGMLDKQGTEGAMFHYGRSPGDA